MRFGGWKCKLLLLAAIEIGAAAGFAIFTPSGRFRSIDISADAKSGLMRAFQAQLSNAPAAVQKFYSGLGNKPLWVTPSGFSPTARAVLLILRRASTEGLPAARYTVEDNLPRADAERMVTLELQMTNAARLYAHDMTFGLLSPSSVFQDVSISRPAEDPDDRLQSAVASGVVERYLQDLEPKAAIYQRWKAALVKYSSLSTRPQTQVEAGNMQAASDRLRQEGFLPDAATQRWQIEESLKVYQEATGINPTGKLDKSTVEAINVPFSYRASQIAMNMERWRWLQRDLGSRYVMVNVPSADLKLFENNAPRVTSRVVVGAPDKPTPILATKAIAVTLNPVWHVPASITKKEILPKVALDPSYLDSKGMQQTETGEIIQLPGAGNALGLAKVEMPNPFDVYLHDTPSKRAFLSDDRALSHGCVRVEQIKDLITEILGLPAEDVDAQIASGKTAQKRLAEPIPIYIQYWTALPDNLGRMGFLQDVYGRDNAMIAAMRGSRMLSSKSA